jgi:hypothetical protein
MLNGKRRRRRARRRRKPAQMKIRRQGGNANA